MSVHRTPQGEWRVRWRDLDGTNRSKVLGRRRDAEAFDAKLKEARRTGALGLIDAGTETLNEYVEGTWAVVHAASLAPATKALYASLWDVHVAPRLGSVRLRDINPEMVARFQADLIAADVGAVARAKSVTLLGGILQRAAERRRIAYNPARLVRKAPVPQRQEARPLAPATIEAMRDHLNPRDATIVTVLAYAGLRPQELRGLRWGDVRDRTLLVNAPKTRSRRTVRLLAPLAVDLAEWRLAQGRPRDTEPVIRGDRGGPWSAQGYAKWRARVFEPAAEAVGAHGATPYTLRHSFASLLLHEGRSAIYVARQLGHSAELTMGTYGHVIDELEDAPRLSAEQAIRQARDALNVPSAFLRRPAVEPAAP